jgi:sugar/nucleoside kinase (ribokinase family)
MNQNGSRQRREAASGHASVDRDGGPSVVIVGHIAFDDITTPQGSATVIGGAAFYSACAAALAGGHAGVVAAIGDEIAPAALASMRALGVDTDGVRVRQGTATTRFSVDYRGPRSGRSLGVQRLAAGEVDVASIPKSYLGARWIHVAPNVPSSQIEIMSRLRPLTNARISVDTIEAYAQRWPERVRAAYRLADLGFVNEMELRLLGLLRTPALVVKYGEQGAEYSSAAERALVPAIPRVPYDSTGAGDVLAGVFLALLARGERVEDSLRAAVELAGASVEGFGIDALLPPSSPAHAVSARDCRAEARRTLAG